MRILDFIQELFKLAHEFHQQMSVLQHQPHAQAQRIFEQIHGSLFLSLTQRYMTEIGHAADDRIGQLEQIIGGIRAGREYEANRYHARGLLVHVVEVHNRRQYEELVHGLDNILIDAAEDAIHTEAA